MTGQECNRREFLAQAAAVSSSILGPAVGATWAQTEPAFSLRYLLASSLYGYTELAEVVRQVPMCGANALDIWPRVHGNQREQLDEMGEARFAELLRQNQVSLGCISQFPLGPFRLEHEMKLAQRFGCPTIVTGAEGPKQLQGSELKAAIHQFVNRLRPHLDLAAECGVTLAIENHANSLIESPDSLKWLIEFRPSEHLAVALAPYHLPQDEALLSDLIRALAPDGIAIFYAWQHGMGCMQKLPKEQELMQLPGRGALDFTPLLAALQETQYAGWTEIFMHPVPRGIPIRETTQQVTAEICQARDYLQACLQ